jgi:hypothetical protein
MALLKYLGAAAVGDVRVLLAGKPLEFGSKHHRLRLPKELIQWDTIPDHSWTRIQVAYDGSRDVFECAQCYFKTSEHGFIVSDCGESVSDVMRRTGLESEAIQDLVHGICEDGISLDDIHAPGLDGFAVRCQCPADRLAESIVAVLSVVARVREAS